MVSSFCLNVCVPGNLHSFQSYNLTSLEKRTKHLWIATPNSWEGVWPVCISSSLHSTQLCLELFKVQYKHSWWELTFLDEETRQFRDGAGGLWNEKHPQNICLRHPSSASSKPTQESPNQKGFAFSWMKLHWWRSIVSLTIWLLIPRASWVGKLPWHRGSWEVPLDQSWIQITSWVSQSWMIDAPV